MTKAKEERESFGKNRMPFLFSNLKRPICLPKEISLDMENDESIKDFVFSNNSSLNEYSFVNDSDSSSSIGVQSSSSSENEDEKEGNEVQSKIKDDDAFTSLDSLENSLPIKRGLSNFFTGKSKSFANLYDASVGGAKDLAKQENPLNKRRRISWSRRASSTLLIKEEEEKEEQDIENREKDCNLSPLLKPLGHGGVRAFGFKSLRSFSLSHLQQHVKLL